MEQEDFSSDQAKQSHQINQKVTSGVHSTYWLDSEKPISYIKPEGNSRTEVVIVGGGIAGLSIAYNLVKAGKAVVVVEDGNIGSGETGRTSAHLASSLDDRYYELERMYGKAHTKHIADSHVTAIDFVEKTIHVEDIACEFKRVDGYLFLHPSDKPESLDKEFIACLSAGLEVQMEENTPVPKGAVGRSIKFGSQAKFHPLKYLKGLSDAIIKSGGIIYTNTHADKIDKDGIVTKEGVEIKADHIVVATNTPIKHFNHLKQHPYRTYIIGARVKKGTAPDVLLWDTGDFGMNSDVAPYHYVRLESYNEDFDLLIVGGEDHLTGLPERENVPETDRYALLEEWTKQYFNIEEIVYHWSGQVLEPVDCLAYIGKFPKEENMYLVTGDSGNGLTHGTIAGMLISDLILGKENVWKEIYDPSRFKIFKSGLTFIKELSRVLVNYVKTRPNAKENEIDSIEQGEGKIVQMEGEKYGVYRDVEDHFHFVDAACTHQKCIVKWNNDEKSWDCPCHGSRFTHEGKVVHGPANKDLMYYKTDPVHVKV